MLRRALTYQLILAVAVGPLLCCCSTGQLSAAFSATPSPTSKTRVAGSCCAHKHSRTDSGAGHGRSDHKQDPSSPAEKCPCKDGAGQPEKIQTEVTDASTLLRTLTAALVLPFTVVGEPSLLTQSGSDHVTFRGPNAALPSTAELLFSHHNLRC